MRKDPKEFRERFQKWKEGAKVYEGGRALQQYKGGKDDDIVDGGDLGEVVVKPDPILRLRLVKAIPNKDMRKGILNLLYKWKLFAEMGKPMYHEEIGRSLSPENTKELPADYEVKQLLNVIEDSNTPFATYSFFPLSKINTTKRATYYPKSNRILIPTGLKSSRIGSDYISELAHAYLYNTDLKDKGVRKNSIPLLKYDAYEDPNNIEYQAHQIIEPSIYQYVRSNNRYLYNSIPHYKYGKSEDLPYDTSIDLLYKIENPHFKNVNVEKGLAKSFHDGFAPTIGPGVANTSGAPSKWFDGQWYKKKDVDDFAYNHFIHGDEVIRNAYDTKFGTTEYPHPSDTISMWPRLYMAQNRYLRGRLGGGPVGTSSILESVASGNAKSIVDSISKYTPGNDINRMSRVLEAYPPVYEKDTTIDKRSNEMFNKILNLFNFKQPKQNKLLNKLYNKLKFVNNK